jgi:hypothetical protein
VAIEMVQVNWGLEFVVLAYPPPPAIWDQVGNCGDTWHYLRTDAARTSCGADLWIKGGQC